MGCAWTTATTASPRETQAPIAVGGEFTYRLRFPDPGLYWYHPHIREDYGLDLGLYGNIIVDPTIDDYWPPADREHVVTLDDVLIEDGRIAPFNVDGPTHVAIGRFGNVMLTAGDTDLELSATAGEIVRLYFTNTANTRLFNVGLPGARMKLIGGDSGRYEHETFVDEVLLAPSERAIVDVVYERPGTFHLEHRTPGHTYVLGTVTVAEPTRRTAASRSASTEFGTLRTAPELTAERASVELDRRRPPDHTLAFESLMPLLYDNSATAADSWTCPMHPEVRSDVPGSCPICGMKLIPASPSAPPSDRHTHDHDHGHDAPDGLEREDLMPEINWASDACNMTRKLVDRDTGDENWHIDWSFHVGDRVKIRLENGMDQDHPMHHPFHIHGAGRFLVLA
jgi:FtsP/CotA-like multicopper oxidase with cupredoxin domain